MKLDIEKKLLITVGIFIIITSAVSFAIILPTVNQINEINQNTEQLRNFMEKKHQTIMGLRKTKIKASEIKEEVFSFINYFYYPEQELKLITELESTAINNSIEQKINGYEIEDKIVKISLNTIGAYQNSIKYINELENLDYFIKIDFLHMSQEQRPKDNSQTVKMNLELSLYVNSN